MKKTRRIVQTLVLLSGLAGSVAAFVSTPKVYRAFGDGIVVPCEAVVSDLTSSCVPDTETASVRGAGVLLLAVFAFVGVTVVFKDDVEGPEKDSE